VRKTQFGTRRLPRQATRKGPTPVQVETDTETETETDTGQSAAEVSGETTEQVVTEIDEP
jgi:hypothetical protein